MFEDREAERSERIEAEWKDEFARDSRDAQEWQFPIPDYLDNFVFQRVESIDKNSFTLIQFTQGLSPEDIQKQKSLHGRDITHDISAISDPAQAKQMVFLRSDFVLPAFRYIELEILEN